MMKRWLVMMALLALAGCGDDSRDATGMIRLADPERIASAASTRWDILRGFFLPLLKDEAYTKWDQASDWLDFPVTEALGIKAVEGVDRGARPGAENGAIAIPPQTGVARIFPVPGDTQILIECKGTFGSPFKMRAQAVRLKKTPDAGTDVGRWIRTLGLETVKLDSRPGSDSARGVLFTDGETKALLVMVYSPQRFKGTLEWVRAADLGVGAVRNEPPAPDDLVKDYALEKTVRPAIFLPVTSRIDFTEVTVPGDAVFQCAMGLPPGAAPGIRVTLEARVSGGEAREIFTWTPGPEDVGWTEIRRDLTPLSGRDVTLSLYCASEVEGRIPLSLAVCGSPLIASRGSGPGRNVILVSLDTLRFDHLGCYGCEKPLSPNVDRLAADGALFENAYAHAAFTLPSHASLFTSLYPSIHGAEDMKGAQRLPDGVERMAQILARHGMSTASFNGGGLISHEFGFHKGFDLYCETDPLKDRFFDRSGEGSLGRALAWMESMKDRSFFLFLHTYMVHDYLPPPHLAEGYGGRYEVSMKTLETIRQKHYQGDGMSGDDLEYLVCMYNATIRAADEMVGELLGAVERLGLGGKTLIIVTSDHGEEFLEHEGILHGFTLYEEMIHIPLILRGPRCRPGLRVTAPVGHVDVLPTVLDLLGIEETAFMNGRSLVPFLDGGALEDRPVFAEVDIPASSERRCVIEGPWKFVQGDTDPSLKVPAPAAEELFRLDLDPGERVNRREEDADRLRHLKSCLEGLEKSLERLKGMLDLTKPEGNVISPQLEEQLRQQGYL